MSPEFPLRAWLAPVWFLFALVNLAQSQTYTYDPAGQLTVVVYPDGSGVRYTYDTSGNLTAVAPVTAPAAPAAPTITSPSATVAELSWGEAAGATNGYIVQRRTSDTDVWTTLAQVPGGRTTYSDSSVPAGLGALYRLQAVSAGGTSAFSAAALAPTADPPAAIARLLNISTRARVGTGADVLIAGFRISGVGTRPVLIRAAGPALLAIDPNFPNPLTDPVLEVFNENSQSLMRNDNWSDGGAAGTLAPAFAAVGAFPFPAASRDAAVRLSLAPGGYTAIVSGAGASTGTALAEVYEESTGTESRLTNISSRALVRVGSEVMIAGFVVGGTRPARVLVRAAGPALGAFGVPGTLADPQLTLFTGTQVAASSDNWGSGSDAAAVRAAATAAGAFAFAENSLDAALLATLAPGNYSAIVSGVNNTTGVALIEVYQLD